MLFPEYNNGKNFNKTAKSHGKIVLQHGKIARIALYDPPQLLESLGISFKR
jgi:hypothetical protein